MGLTIFAGLRADVLNVDSTGHIGRLMDGVIVEKVYHGCLSRVSKRSCELRVSVAKRRVAG